MSNAHRAFAIHAHGALPVAQAPALDTLPGMATPLTLALSSKSWFVVLTRSHPNVVRYNRDRAPLTLHPTQHCQVRL